MKVVPIGSKRVGKTCLLIRHALKKFPEDYIPTVFDNYSSIVEKNNKTYKLDLWDATGAEEHELFRPLSYPQTDVILICFSITQPNSLKVAAEKLIAEVNHHAPGVPLLY